VVDLRSLAAFRMLLGTFIVLDLCYRWPELDVWLTDDGIVRRSEWLEAEAGAVNRAHDNRFPGRCPMSFCASSSATSSMQYDPSPIQPAILTPLSG